MSTAIRLRTVVTSERVHVPGLAQLLGQRVEVLVIPESMIRDVATAEGEAVVAGAEAVAAVEEAEPAPTEGASSQAGPAPTESTSGEPGPPITE